MRIVRLFQRMAAPRVSLSVNATVSSLICRTIFDFMGPEPTIRT